ncbi:MAG: tetratricopeptide repeat protein [Bryobacteraceae bacterium]|nr:tetratricopeptide repeat protein [Bryobacteraceae bacterium]
MFRRVCAWAGGLALLLPAAGWAQGRTGAGRIDVEQYSIDAEVNPRTQTLAAVVRVKFTPLEDTSLLQFELNNALNLARVTDTTGRQVPASRLQQDSSVRLSLPAALPKGQTATFTFTYDGTLTGNEESPVFGIKFAAVQPDYAYLLYPARWFPVSGYSTDRFAADIKVTVPRGFRVVASGTESADTAPEGKQAYKFEYRQASFPGSVAVVKGEPRRETAGGVTTTFFFRDGAAMTPQYGQEIGRIMTFFTGLFGLPPKSGLTVVETEAGTPNGYSAPGLLFLSPRTIGREVNAKVLANQISRQWWGMLVSPTTRNSMWWENGLARYSEFLYVREAKGPAAFEAEMRDTYIEALTVENPPLSQSARLEDYSPEYWAATAGKGAAILNMLRHVIGDENFARLLKAFPERFSFRSASTADFQKVAEEIASESLNYFFIEWVESAGAPEFKLEYTVFRTSKGFRVVGKVAQDLDTFRMPMDVRIETEGNPETKRVEVVGTSSEFAVDTFGKPKKITLDPQDQVLKFNDSTRLAVAIRRGEQFAEIGDFTEALKEYQKALDVSRNSSLAHYRVGELFFLQNNYQAAANEFRAALSGDLEPKWTEVWAHVQLGKIFDITDQRVRAVNEYKQALRTKDNTQGALEEAQKYVESPYQRPKSNN